MLKRNWALIWLVYLAFAEVLSLVSVPDLSLCLIQPEHSQQSSNQIETKYCPAFHTGAALAFEKVDGWLERHDKSVIGVFTIVLAISTIGLWLATNKLWAAGERQLVHLDGASKHQLRAYIHIEKVEVLGKLNSDVAPHFRITFKNYGHTPAHKVSHTCGIALVFGGDPRHRKPKVYRYADLGPSQHRSSIYYFGDIAWQMMRPGLKQEDGKIFFDGEIIYFDAFQMKEGATEPHRTRYRFQLVEAESGNGALWFADEGNESN